ncbi:Eaa1 [Klebsiella variicola]|nr:Eaa1 [Klebsiella variicola]
MKDHEIRELVNQLRDVAIKYHGAGQLREQIARTVRAAILQAQLDDDGEPTDDERIIAIEGIHSCERCGDEGWVVGEMGITRCACNQGNPVFKIDLNSDFIKHVKAVSEKVRAANSPVIPDGYVMVPKEPTEEMLAAAKEWTGLTSTAEVVYVKMLAAAPQSRGNEPATVTGKWIPVSERMPDCWCRTCRPVDINDMRFVVCPDCGNKRCPRANDHRNACTGSNEPGQEGSAYPSAHQEVK